MKLVLQGHWNLHLAKIQRAILTLQLTGPLNSLCSTSLLPSWNTFFFWHLGQYSLLSFLPTLWLFSHTLPFGIHAIIFPTLKQNKDVFWLYFPHQLTPYTLLLFAAKSLKRVAYTHCLLCLSFHSVNTTQTWLLPNPTPIKSALEKPSNNFHHADSYGQFSISHLPGASDIVTLPPSPQYTFLNSLKDTPSHLLYCYAAISAFCSPPLPLARLLQKPNCFSLFLLLQSLNKR